MTKLLFTFLISVAAFAQSGALSPPSASDWLTVRNTLAEPSGTFRVGIIPAEFFQLFNLPITPEAKGADQVTVTVMRETVAVGYLVSVVSKRGKVSQQIAFRREGVCMGEACNAYLPIAQFWVVGGVERVTVQSLVLGDAATQQLSN